MKALVKCIIVAAGICFLMTCSNTDEFLNNNQDNNSLKSTTKTVTVPFKANFSVWDHSDYSDNSCGGFPVFFLTMKGYGPATHLGKMTTTMTFCCNTETGYYYNTTGSFISANGDELFFEIPEGQIIPNEGDNSYYYQTKFNDRIIFTGGTGRFAGATGEAYTNAYVHDGTDEWRTDFFSTGTLTLVNGKQ
jgi:hypothetical protein